MLPDLGGLGRILWRHIVQSIHAAASANSLLAPPSLKEPLQVSSTRVPQINMDLPQSLPQRFREHSAGWHVEAHTFFAESNSTLLVRMTIIFHRHVL